MKRSLLRQIGSGGQASNVQRKRWTGVAAALIVACSAFGEVSRLEEAARPLEEGVPQVAVLRLRTLLKSDLAPEERKSATAKLGEALFAADQAEEALKILADTSLQDLPAIRFWQAQALANLRRWNEALPLFQQAATEAASPFRASAILGEAEALRALGRSEEAIQTFALLFSDARWKDRAELRSVELLLDKKDNSAARRLLDKTKPAALGDKKLKRFLQGRVEAQLNHRERAIELFQTILRRPESASRAVLIATLCAIAEANLELGTPENGDDPLEDFIEHHPTDPELPAIFEKLDQVYRAERQPSSQELSRWAKDSIQPRRALAQWYLARSELRAGRRDAALRIFGQLRTDSAKLPMLAEAFFEFAKLEIEDRHFDEAIAILNEAGALRPGTALLDRMNLLAGRAQYLAKQFQAAAETFEKVAHTSPGLAGDSLFNASLAWLQLGDNARYLTDARELNQSGGNEEAPGDLALEEGLTQAAQGNKKAADTLQKFLREFPKHKRTAEAWVALAELEFHGVPPHVDEARKSLARARESEPNAAARERTDYLLIWIEEGAPNADPGKVIEFANQFLQKYPASQFVSEVRMKLAETYYRRQDFPNAQTQFQILAQENPKSAFTEKALFFAAKAATQSMGAQSLDRALVLLDEVVKKNGELKWAARNEQAAIERKLGKPQDATTLYEEVLRGEAKPEEKREALCGNADILYESGATERENYRRAIEIYDQLAAQKDAPPHWRNQALFKKGICLEKLDERHNALATFYKIIEEESRPDRPREFFWYYKAGFNAARLLEDDSKWQPAAVVYQKLASAGGARSDEAKSRLSRLRLEHFLWEQ